VITSYIIHLPSYYMQLAVVSAVRNAVRAATNIFTVISINFVFFIFTFLHCFIFTFLKIGPFLKFCNTKVMLFHLPLSLSGSIGIYLALRGSIRA